MTFSLGDDTIDSREVIERLEELQAERADLVASLQTYQAALTLAHGNMEAHEQTDENNADTESLINALEEATEEHDSAADALQSWGDDNGEELANLVDLNAQGDSYCRDWKHGETLILDSYFEEYAQQTAEDIGAIDPKATWPLNFIDWERAADALKMDYNAIEVAGYTYWVRS